MILIEILHKKAVYIDWSINKLKPKLLKILHAWVNNPQRVWNKNEKNKKMEKILGRNNFFSKWVHQKKIIDALKERLGLTNSYI